MSIRAAILARVSSEEQATVDRHSLPVQVEKMQRFAALKGWEVVRTFEIPGESAYKDEIALRPEFAAAIDAAERGQFDVLIIDEISRFAREQSVAHDAMKRLRRAGVQLWSASLDMEMISNPMIAGIFSAVAQESSRLQGAKIAAAKDRRHQIGLHSGDIPFGYRATGPGLPVEPHPEEAEAVRWAFERFLITTSHLEIARQLTEQGFRPHSKRGKTHFERSTIERMLTSRFYVGEVTHNGQALRGAHEPIIPESLWDDVQSKRNLGGTRGSKTQRMCSGLVVCRQCQRKLVTQRSSEKWYYREQASTGVACGAKRKGINVDLVHQQLDLVFGQIDYRDEAWLAYVNEREARPVAQSIGAEQAELEDERRRLNAMFRKGYLEEREYDEAMAEVSARRAALPLPFNAVREALVRVTSFADVWGRVSEESKREAVRLVLEYVEADTDAKLIRLKPRAEYAGLLSMRSEYCAKRLDWYARQESSGRNEPRLYLPSELVAA